MSPKAQRGRCQGEGDRAGCLGVPDERYTMDFTDIGEGHLYWCAACGPEVKVMDEALTKALQAPGFAAKLEAAMDDVRRKVAN